jgi:O-antigen/teichoic acid export membrane protein
MLLVPLYTGHLTPAEFGTLELIQRTGDVLLICLMLGGLRLAALTFYQQAPTDHDRARVAATTSVAVLLLLLLLGAIVLLSARFLSTATRVGSPDLLCFGLLATLLEATMVVPLVLIQARTESVLFVLATVTIVIVRIGLTVIAVVILRLGLWGILAAQAVASAIVGLALTIRELRHGSFIPDLRLLPAILRFALPFVPAGLCAFIINNGDRYVLVHTADTAIVGTYGLAYKLALVVGLVAVSPPGQVWSVRMYDAEKTPAAGQTFGRMFSRITCSYVVVGFTVCVFAAQLVRLLAPPEYGPATVLVAPIVLAYYFWNASMLMDGAFYVRRQTRRKPAILVASTAVTVGLYTTLIPHWGALGAAWATVGGFVVHAAVTWTVSQRVLRVEYEWCRVSATLLTAVVLVWVMHYLPSTGKSLLIRAGLWSAWMAAAWRLGAASKADKVAATAGIRRVMRHMRGAA